MIFDTVIKVINIFYSCFINCVAASDKKKSIPETLELLGLAIEKDEERR